MCGMLGTCSCLQDGPVRETETETASCFYLSGAETARSVWYLLVTRAAAIVVTVDANEKKAKVFNSLLLKCKYSLVSLLLFDSKLNIFRLWTFRT